MTDHVDGKVVVVTGAASGFGRLVAQMVAARGAKVVLGDIDESGLKATATSIEDAGGQVVHRRTDVTDRADVAGLAALVEASAIRSSRSLSTMSPAEMVSSSDWSNSAM